MDFIFKGTVTPRFQMIFSRIRKMIFKSFQLDLRYRAFPLQSKKNESILKSLLKINNPLYLADRLIIPVYDCGAMVGLTELKGGHKLDKNHALLIKNLVELLSVCESSVEKLSSLIKVEQQLALNEAKHGENVIFIHKHLRNHIKQTNKHEPAYFNQNFSTDFSTLIHSNSYDDIKMLALEIHSRSLRYAFLQWEDINLKESNTRQLVSLGAISLLIPELADLEDKDRVVVERILRLPQDNPSPRLIVGTLHAPEVAFKKSGLDQRSQKKLALFNMNREFSEYSSSDLNTLLSNGIYNQLRFPDVGPNA